MNKTFLPLVASLWFLACMPKKQADLIIVDARIQTCDTGFSFGNAMVIGDGRVLAVGDAKELLTTYRVDSQLSYKGKFIYPGLVDAHCHFFGLGMFLQRVDLTEAISFENAVDMCMKYYSKQTTNHLYGRGWDQNKWPEGVYPTNAHLNHAFPDIPVLLKRVDGHAAIANDYALQLAGITAKTMVSGGQILLEKGKPTGVLIDNAVDLVEAVMPKPTYGAKIKALIDAQDYCFRFGLSAVTDAGLDTDIIFLIDSLQKAGILKIRINAMVSLTQENLDFWLNRGPLKTERLQVNSFKMYGDGALGSRGACLTEPYADEPGHCGFLLTPQDDMEQYILQLAASPFQLCTHAIGDSTNRLLIQLYGKYVGHHPDRRWRIEHAQVVNPKDRNYFGKYGIIPSVQPAHATSDMYWAEKRLGKERLEGAYAYRSLLNELGWIPLGTDFPVESVSPFFTFFAAITRRDEKGEPKNGFEIKESLTRHQALLGMTTWAAKASFQEAEMGSLAPGTFADFVVLDHDLLTANMKEIRMQKAIQTFIHGVPVN